jgi:hypothetical protein
MKRALLLPAVVALIGVCTSPAAATSSLAGRGSGHWHVITPDPHISDAPRVFALHGHGNFGGKNVTITGKMGGIGFIDRARCTVRLQLTTSNGTITVRGASVKRYPGFSECGHDFAFHYRSHKPTGNYAGKSFSGRGHLVLKSAKQTASHTKRFVVRLN